MPNECVMRRARAIKRKEELGDKCSCGAELQIRTDWMGPDNPLPFDFYDVIYCPLRHLWNFWKHGAVSVS